MGEAKDKKDNPPPVTRVTVTRHERIALAQLLDAQNTTDYKDRRARRRVRQAVGIVPKVHVLKQVTKIDDKMSYIQWSIGKPADDNGFHVGKKIADRAAQVTGETVDYLIKLTETHEVPDAQSETMLDVEEKLHAVKDDTYKSPPDDMPGVDDPSDEDEFEDVTDPEE